MAKKTTSPDRKKLEASYLAILKSKGGAELHAAGVKVLADLKAGKKIKLPKGRRPAADAPKVSFMMAGGGTVVLCTAACFKYANPWAIAGCIALCLGLGVPPI